MSFPSRLLAATSAALLLFATATLHADNKKRPAQHHAPAVHHSHPHRSPARHTMRSGSSIERHGGRVAGFHDERRHMDVHRSLSGHRRVEVMRGDHSRLVAYSGHRGFVEHPYTYGGHAYFGRTYYRNGRPFGYHLYRTYGWHGYGLHVWVPGHYYHHAFYGWLYHPWGPHVVYAWSWYHRPWYGYYGYYYAPYAVYPSAAAWLTDYALSQDLAASYQSYDTPPPSAYPPADSTNPTFLTPEVKSEIDQEIQDELAIDDAAAELTEPDADANAPTGISRTFTDGKPHVFVVNTPIDVEDADTGNECSLTAGDVLRTTEAPGPDDKAADLTVAASKRGPQECAPNITVSVPLDELQEMQNGLRERVADGLDELQKKQGTDGLPAMPADAAGTIQPPYAAAAPPPDNDAGGAIDKQMTEADAAEHDVTAEESQEPGAPSAPASAPDTPGQQPPAPIERRPPS